MGKNWYEWTELMIVEKTWETGLLLSEIRSKRFHGFVMKKYIEDYGWRKENGTEHNIK